MIIFLLIISVLVLGTYFFMQQPKFGKHPSGSRLERIKKSPNYKNGSFNNKSFTPQLAENVSMSKLMWKFLFGKKVRVKPSQKFNLTKTDLKNLDPDENIYVWMGHSSYFLQIDGKKILVDPVFSGSASPIATTTRSFAGTDIYSTEDIPQLDYLIISHDHWDHLDFKTVKKLKPKVKKVITGLGTGEHLEYWNYDPEKIIELDWGENFDLGNGFKIYCETARHFSGRTFTRNKAIWASFVLKTPKRKIYIGGDSGFDVHFEEIGKKYGGFDLAILENGQYNDDWKYIHMLPEEFLVAAKNLNSKRIIAVHNSKFALAFHSWDQPLKEITKLNDIKNQRLITPKIGEKVNWENDEKIYEKWWEQYN